MHRQHQRQVPKTPVSSTFAARQIQSAQKKKAAAILFTPHAPHQGRSQVHTYQSQASPTPHYPHQTPESPILSSTSRDSDVEVDVRVSLEKLNLERRSSSGLQSPCAGPHSKQAKVRVQTKGGAKDVWTFFDKTAQHRTCILCK